MTPGILAAQRAKVAFTVHEYEHDPAAESYGNEAVEKTGANPDQVFKTLVVSLDGKDLAVAVVPVSAMLSLKLIARAAGAKKAAMADKQLVQRTTGYVLGGVSPLGQKKQLKTFIDDSASNFATLFVSAGKRGLEIELAPEDLARLTGATFAPLQQD
ncbi:Cys-tRNA(Pro) deacylase [Marinobacter sp. UBA3607]|jgi:Cys-tRNA(Pro)/Cys-tRNA(Cys) deacylase|uniref:Cys-tRNA(Pro) deacylase n=1 Tax=Marinobacter sp. UBA3607 TaxID=1946820 RepID=UPI00257B706A|nr:Cys-tRNA(Pro) deacylase [Marinobacter sp. UBA3607]|tara:strand:- start:2372 stop:2842 length:471 start_codon:yes stop_codon:yes gene_type:complete